MTGTQDSTESSTLDMLERSMESMFRTFIYLNSVNHSLGLVMSEQPMPPSRKQYLFKSLSLDDAEATRCLLKRLNIIHNESNAWFIIFCSDVQYDSLTTQYGMKLVLDDDDGLGY